MAFIEFRRNYRLKWRIFNSEKKPPVPLQYNAYICIFGTSIAHIQKYFTLFFRQHLSTADLKNKRVLTRRLIWRQVWRRNRQHIFFQ